MDTAFFVASKLFWLLLRPDSWIVLLSGLTLAGILWNRRRLALWAAGVELCFLLSLAILPLGDLLVAPLERRYPLGVPPEAVAGIIVLGGAEEGSWTVVGPQVRFNQAGERLTEGVRLARAYPDARLVFTGGSGAIRNLDAAPVSGVTVAERFFREQGIEAERLVIENRSRNTAENAVFTRDLVQPGSQEKWLLVTSAFHMGRSMRSFETAGWSGVTAWPVDFRARRVMTGSDWDLNRNLDLFSTALREHIGLLAYRLSGR